MNKFTKQQIDMIRKAYGTLSKIDPNKPTYKKFIKFLDKLPKDQLRQLDKAEIKWISTLAANRLRRQGESVKEGDLGLTYKKGKTVKVKHKTSGKRLVIVDKPAVRKEYEKIGYFAESVNENDKVKVLKHLIKKGDNPKDAKKDVSKFYNKVSKMYKKASIQKKAEIISSLSGKNESVDEGLNVQAYSDLNRSIKSVANNVKDLAKAHKKQDDGVVRNEIDNLLYDVKRMVNIIGNKKYNESVDEGKYTVHFDMGSPGLMSKTVDAKDKKEAAKKVASGLSGKFKIKKVTKESVNEGEKRQSSEITAKFDKAYLNFAREVRDVISRVDRSTGDRTDGKIIAKAYTKYLLPLDKLMQSWNKTQQKNPHIDEGFADKLTKKMKKHKGTKVKKIKLTGKMKSIDISNEAIEPSGIMDKINKIVQDKQAAKISGVLMDMFSASIMMRIYNSVNDKSKEQMNKGNIRQVQVILHKVMKQNKVTK
tara:strand:+ start:68 stop:1504 length:1437 start_codon:yes stop_codon:yes gene_type:complete